MFLLRSVGAIFSGDTFAPSLAPSLDPRKSTSVGVAVADPGTARVVEASQRDVTALRPQCAEGCAGDRAVAADPEVFARCVSICSSTGDLETAIRNASAGAFCRRVLETAAPALGTGGPGDYQRLFEQCQSNPDAFLGELRRMGLDLGVSYETWFKRNWKYVAIGGAALLGLLIVRRRRR